MATIQCANCKRELTPQQAGEACPNCGSRDRNLRAEDVFVLRDKAIMARELARRHAELEPGLKRVIRCSGSAEVEVNPVEPIKFVEVNVNTIPSGVVPLRFGPVYASGLPFPSTIVEITPEEYQQLQAQTMRLPEGWNISDDLLSAE
jgi:hypothetical protein